jgi:hypothetical protein
VNKQKWQQSQGRLTTLKVHKSTRTGLPKKKKKKKNLKSGHNKYGGKKFAKILRTIIK